MQSTAMRTSERGVSEGEDTDVCKPFYQDEPAPTQRRWRTAARPKQMPGTTPSRRPGTWSVIATREM
jgi:hypothetical protein